MKTTRPKTRRSKALQVCEYVSIFDVCNSCGSTIFKRVTCKNKATHIVIEVGSLYSGGHAPHYCSYHAKKCEGIVLPMSEERIANSVQLASQRLGFVSSHASGASKMTSCLPEKKKMQALHNLAIQFRHVHDEMEKLRSDPFYEIKARKEKQG